MLSPPTSWSQKLSDASTSAATEDGEAAATDDNADEVLAEAVGLGLRVELTSLGAMAGSEPDGDPSVPGAPTPARQAPKTMAVTMTAIR